MTSFVCVTSDCITITEHLPQHIDRRSVPDLAYEKRQVEVNTIPEEVPTKAPNGQIERYAKRQAEVNTIPEEVPTKAPNGQIERYAKRQVEVNTIPEEVPTKAPNGQIERY